MAANSLELETPAKRSRTVNSTIWPRYWPTRASMRIRTPSGRFEGIVANAEAKSSGLRTGCDTSESPIERAVVSTACQTGAK